MSALLPKADTLTGGHRCPLCAMSRHEGLSFNPGIGNRSKQDVSIASMTVGQVLAL
jgi:hypothetical protein